MHGSILLETLPGMLRDIVPGVEQDIFLGVHASAGEREKAGVCGQGDDAAGNAEKGGELFLYNENFVELSVGAGRDGCCGTHTNTHIHTHTNTHTHAHTHIHIHTLIHTHTTYTCTYIYM
jgi:hypothetical protein